MDDASIASSLTEQSLGNIITRPLPTQARPQSAPLTRKQYTPADLRFTPNTDRWRESHGALPQSTVQKVIENCVEKQQKNRPKTAGTCSLGRKSLADMMPKSISQRKDFQEIQGIKERRALERRRHAAEQYLKNDLKDNGKPLSLLFDYQKFSSQETKLKKELTMKMVTLRSKKTKHIPKKSFYIPESTATSVVSTIKSMKTPKRTLYSQLKEAVRHVKSSNAVDLMGQESVDYPSAEAFLQRAFILRADAFGVDDPRTQPAIVRLQQCYAAQNLDKEEDLAVGYSILSVIVVLTVSSNSIVCNGYSHVE